MGEILWTAIGNKFLLTDPIVWHQSFGIGVVVVVQESLYCTS